MLIALEHAVVGELEDVVAVEHGRELEQRVAGAHPQVLERRVHAGRGGEEAGVVRGVAVERPGVTSEPARSGQRRGGLGDEARVRVVDAAGAMALVQVAAERDGDEQQQQDEPRRSPSAHACSPTDRPRSYDRWYVRQRALGGVRWEAAGRQGGARDGRRNGAGEGHRDRARALRREGDDRRAAHGDAGSGGDAAHERGRARGRGGGPGGLGGGGHPRER